MNLAEVGPILRSSRCAAGLTQAEVAAMVGVSRATLNAVENGRGDISSITLFKVAELLSISIDFVQRTKRPQASKTLSPLEMAANSASVSYKTALPSEALKAALLSGKIDMKWTAHVAHFVDEQSDPMVLSVVREVSESSGMEPRTIWRNAKALARSLDSVHPRWKQAV